MGEYTDLQPRGGAKHMALLRRLKSHLGLRKPKPSWKPAQFLGPRPPNASEVLGGKFERRSDITTLIRAGGVGVELGVAKGEFSATLLEKTELAHLYSIDMWAGDRDHDVVEYREAIQRLDKHRARNSILRMTFEEALPLFPDSSFDFIYIDGYPEYGQEGGKTLGNWWPKLKPGGLFAGDGYTPRYPLVVEAVDRFARDHDLSLCLIEPQFLVNEYSKHPSWLCFKPDP